MQFLDSKKEAWELQRRKSIVVGVAPYMWIMDNYQSLELKAAFKVENIIYAVVPSHNHGTNLADRSICTFNNYFVVGLC